MTYRLWINEDKTILMRLWDSGKVEAATRSDSSAIWGPPVALVEEADAGRGQGGNA